MTEVLNASLPGRRLPDDRQQGEDLRFGLLEFGPVEREESFTPKYASVISAKNSLWLVSP